MNDNAPCQGEIITTFIFQNSHAQVCLLLGNVSQVNGVAHGPLVA